MVNVLTIIDSDGECDIVNIFKILNKENLRQKYSEKANIHQEPSTGHLGLWPAVLATYFTK